MGETEASAPSNVMRPLSALASISTVNTISLVAAIVGIGVILAHHPFSLPERGDVSICDSVAQSILRGQIPYRDVIEIKSPLAAYLSAMAIATGRAFGLQDVEAVRLLSVFLIGLLSYLTCVAAALYLRSRLAAIIASVVPLLPNHLA